VHLMNSVLLTFLREVLSPEGRERQGKIHMSEDAFSAAHSLERELENLDGSAPRSMLIATA
jgi:hypothetical protein